MLAQGIKPARTIYYAFGHDEEQGGIDGALEIAKLLEKRGVEAEFLVDRGACNARRGARQTVKWPSSQRQKKALSRCN